MSKYSCQYERGATVTVFAPYDCGNRCPFCVNKKDYLENAGFDVNNVIESMKVMHSITPSCDFVFTGGEPFAELKSLELLISTVKKMNDESVARGLAPHNLFINTTFPLEKNSLSDMLDIIEDHKDTITGINVSRHIRKYVKECDDMVFDVIPVPVRINCVLFNAEDGLLVKDFIERFENRKSVVGVQFREDYTKTTLDNLYILDNDEVPTFRNVLSALGVNGTEAIEKWFAENCISKNDFRWNCAVKNRNVTYHRTLPYSTIIKEDGTQEINDIIVNPRGIIRSDWNDYGEELDLEAYRNREY
ncbi:MAG: 4Fe-4S cluster-binding domain-containing protein [Clostridia bacterium]|nr:4Fe-4S cluster-binding domain-containing protein [Clostridia bacterium]